VGNIKGAAGPPGSSGGTLITLYSVDLSTLTGANLLAGGDATKTIDSRATWALKNSANAQTCYLNDGTHAGLYMRVATVSTDYSGATITAPRFIVGLSDLTGLKWQELIEQWAMVMFSQPHTPNANYQGARIGIKFMPDASENGLSYQLCRAYNGGLVDTIEQRSISTSANLSTTYNGLVVPPLTDDVVAFRILANSLLEIYSGASVAGAFPSVHNLTLRAIAQMVAFNANASGYQQNLLNAASGQAGALQWSLLFAVSASTDTSGNSDLLIKKLQVLGR